MKQVKKYLDRNPKVGDMVEANSNPFGYGDHKVGYEYKVTKLCNGYIGVSGERMPAGKEEIYIHDNQYDVFEIKIETLPKEIHIKEYSLLGIKLFTRKTLVFDGESKG